MLREEGRSAKDTDRPQLQKLLEAVRRGAVDAVVVTKIDRLTRSVKDFYDLWAEFEEHNVQLISVRDQFDTTTPMGKAMVNMILTFAQLEREMTAERTRVKMLWHAEQGLWNGGRPPGYRLDPKQKGMLSPDPEDKKLAELIFKKYVELGSVGELARYLSRQGITTPRRTSRRDRKVGGKPFYKTTLLGILRNPVYLGKIRYNGNVYKGRHEPIISEELFNEVNAHLMLHAPKHRNPRVPREHVYLLQSLVICGKCGAHMTPKTCTSTKQDNFYYQCTKNSHTNGSACSMRYASAPALEQAILGKLRDIALQPGEVERIVREASANTDGSLKELAEDRRRVEARLETVVAETRKIIDVLKELGKDGLRTVGDELRKLEAERVALEAQRDDIVEELNVLERRSMDANVMATSLRTFADVVEEATPDEMKRLVPMFVDRIVFHEPDKGGNGKVQLSLFECPVRRDGEGCNQSGFKSAESSDWLPGPYSARNPKSLGTKDSVRAVDLRNPYYLHWQDHTLDFTWGERPALLPGGRPLTQRQLEAYRNHQARVSPLQEARRFQAELNHAAVKTKAEVARRFGVSRVRVVQYLNLLTLDPQIISFLDTSYGDPLVAATFTERRLRELLATSTPATQWTRFQKMLDEARSNPGVWNPSEVSVNSP